MKVWGVLLLIGAAGLLGLWKANTYTLRVKELMEMQTIFRMLETEITYHLTPAPIALAQMVPRIGPLYGQFFQTVSEEITMHHQVLQEAWRMGMQQLSLKSCCRKEDLELLGSFGQNFGEGDLLEQQKNFQLLQDRLSYQLIDAQNESKKNQRLWKYMGFCTGAAIALMLV